MEIDYCMWKMGKSETKSWSSFSSWNVFIPDII